MAQPRTDGGHFGTTRRARFRISQQGAALEPCATWNNLLVISPHALQPSCLGFGVKIAPCSDFDLFRRGSCFGASLGSGVSQRVACAVSEYVNLRRMILTAGGRGAPPPPANPRQPEGATAGPSSG